MYVVWWTVVGSSEWGRFSTYDRDCYAALGPQLRYSGNLSGHNRRTSPVPTPILILEWIHVYLLLQPRFLPGNPPIAYTKRDRETERQDQTGKEGKADGGK